MLCYWILRLPGGAPAGLVRVQNDRVLLKPTASIPGTFTLFSAASAVPILPETETPLPRAEALIGMDGDRMTCYASAEGAAPIASYRKRMSQLCTNKESEPAKEAVSEQAIPKIAHVETEKAESVADTAESEDDISQFNTMYVDSISDSARETQAFSLLLQRANAFYAAYEGDLAEDLVHNKDNKTEEQGGIELFSQEFPGARWRYVDGSDILPHYEGTWRQPNGATLHILAVRGHAAPRPPRALLGFTRFLRDRDGTGYWLRMTPLG